VIRLVLRLPDLVEATDNWNVAVTAFDPGTPIGAIGPKRTHFSLPCSGLVRRRSPLTPVRLGHVRAGEPIDGAMPWNALIIVVDIPRRVRQVGLIE